MMKKAVTILLIAAMLCMNSCNGNIADTESIYTVNIEDTAGYPSEQTEGSSQTDVPSTESPEESDDETAKNIGDGVSSGEVTSPDTVTDKDEEPPIVEDETNTVLFSKTAGVYSDAFTLTLTCPEGYDIYYTTDGSDPRKTGKKYTQGIRINDTSALEAGTLAKLNATLNRHQYSKEPLPGGLVVKAYAKKGSESLGVITNTYFVIKNASSSYGVPFVSVSLAPEDFLSRDRGIYYTVMADPFAKKERRDATVEIFESNGKRVCRSYAEIAMNGNGSLGLASKSMRLYLKNSPYADPGDGKLRYDIFLGMAKDGVEEYKRLLLRNSGNDSSHSHLRDAYMQKMCSALNVPIMAYRPAMLFIDGEFWGVYNLRERFDTKYFKEHFGIPEEDLVMIEAPSPLTTNWVVDEPYVLNDGEPGDEKPFHELVEYIKKHDMANAAEYKYVCDRLDVDNMIDFFVGSMYMANIDWPTNNIKVYRSKNVSGTSAEHTKWRFVFCDMDMGCGLEADYDKDMFTHALNENTVAGTMFVRLLENDTFRTKFISRMTQCANEIFEPTKAISVLDGMAKVTEKIMPLHFDRWKNDGGSMSLWRSEIESIRTFMKRRATNIKSHMSAYLGVTQTQAMFSIDLSKAQLSIDGKSITESGYAAVLSDNGTVNVKVTPKSGYVCTGISVTDERGNTVVYNKDQISVKLSRTATVVCMVSKQNLHTVPKLEAGSRSLFALDAMGNLYSWGKNENAQNGLYTKGDMNAPTLVATGITDVAISRGGTEGDAPHTLVLTDTGRVMTIGNNAAGQLGRRGDTFILTDIGFSKKIKAISAGLDHSLILTEDGELYGCGNNAYGQIGRSNYGATSDKFVKIASSVSKIAAGRRHTLYITTDGKLYAVGDNRWNKVSSSAPEVMSTPHLLASDAKDVYAGQHNSLYINTKGELYYFGWRDTETFTAGQSNGKMNKIADGVKKASIMDEHIIFLKTNGDVYGYGLNNHCQISADKQTKSIAYKIMSGCVDITAGTHFSGAVKSNGDVVVWGSNIAGVYGNGTTEGESNTPIKVKNIEVK